jgi:ubiquinone/menaquinone biosynthesis C-methylase UbiE
MLGVQESVVLSWVREISPDAVLDVGGGHGQLAVPLARGGYNIAVLGSDPVCAKRIDTEIRDGKIRFQTGNVLALPFPDQSFDIVVSVRLLPHCGRWQDLIRELCRVARKSVIVDYPVESHAAAFLFSAKKKLEGNTRTWLSFSHAAVQAEFEKNGFRPKRRTGQFFLPMVLHRTLKCCVLSSFLENVCRGLGLTRRWGSPVLVEMERA